MTKKASRRLLMWLSAAAGILALLIFVGTAMLVRYTDPRMDELFANRSLEYTTTLYSKNSETGEYEKMQ